MSEVKFPVLEIFGPTVQGEGMVIGRKTCFVRFAACDYQCVWCDSKFTWDGSVKPTLMNSEEILTALIALQQDHLQHNRVDHITISGGNPALFKGLDQLVNLLHQAGFKVAIETQGSHWNEALLEIDEVTLSPKPPSSEMITDFPLLTQIIQRLKGRNISLKVVIFNDEDLRYAEEIYQLYPDIPLYLQVGNDRLEDHDEAAIAHYLLQRYRQLVDKVMQSTALKNVRVLPQLHALLWGNRRGV